MKRTITPQASAVSRWARAAGDGQYTATAPWCRFNETNYYAAGVSREPLGASRGCGQYTATALSCTLIGIIPPGGTEKNKNLIEPKSGKKSKVSLKSGYMEATNEKADRIFPHLDNLWNTPSWIRQMVEQSR